MDQEIKKRVGSIMQNLFPRYLLQASSLSGNPMTVAQR